MAKLIKGVQLDFLEIEKSASVPIYRQLERQIRDAILNGVLKSGLRMPASRVLAQEMGVSRPTIVQVYEYLSFEGFLETQRGAGTFVASALPAYIPKPYTQSQNHPLNKDATKMRLSKTGRKFQQLNAHFDNYPLAAFMPNIPAVDEFPFSLWQKIRKTRIKKDQTRMFGYEEPMGYKPLRTAISEYLAVHRGDHCDPEQILIVPGAHFAFHLTALLLSDPGDKIWLEDPGPENVRLLFSSLGRTIAPVDVDQQGMDVDAAINRYSDARLAFTMPSRQHPLGVSLSLPRRLKILEWARTNNSWIIEDDYDSEFHYSGRPLSSMRSIDANQNVIYVGTFSKSLFPALRIAYLVLPEQLVGTFRNAIGTLARSVSTLEQATLADFIDQGHFAAHIRQMYNLYSNRRDIFCRTAQRTLSGLLDIDIPDSGINTLGWLPVGANDIEVYQAARSNGIYCLPLSSFRSRPSTNSGLVLGFASVDEVEIEQKLTLLASVLKHLANIQRL